jgi:hypothetical protein
MFSGAIRVAIDASFLYSEKRFSIILLFIISFMHVPSTPQQAKWLINNNIMYFTISCPD